MKYTFASLNDYRTKNPDEFENTRITWDIPGPFAGLFPENSFTMIVITNPERKPASLYSNKK